MFDLQSLIKYLLEGLAVAVAAYLIPRRRATLTEVALIALTAAAVFAVLDQFAPLVSVGARHGAGFGIGLQQVGWGGYGVEGFNDPSLQGSEYEGYDDYETGEGFQDTTTSTNGDMSTTTTTTDPTSTATTTNNGTTGTATTNGEDDVVDSQGVCNLSSDGNTCTYSTDVATDKRGYYLCRKDGNACTAVRACKKVCNTGGVQCQLDPQVDQNQSQFPDLAGRVCQLQDVNGRQHCRLTQKEGFTSSEEIVGFEGFSKVF